MLTNIYNVFLSLICASVDPQKDLDLNNITLTDEDYVKLYKLAKKHDVAHLLGYSLKINGIMPDNSELAQKIKKQALLAAFRVEQNDIVLKKAQKAFSKGNIKYILLKGTVIREFYPERWMRTSSDIDVLINECDIDTALPFLQEQGFKVEKKSTYDVSLRWENGLELELHYNIIGYDAKNKKYSPITDVWNYAIKIDDCQYALRDEMFYYYHMAHLTKHFISGGCGVRPIIDLWLLNKNITPDEQKKQQLLQNADLIKFDGLINQLVEVWFNNQPHNKETEQIESYILTGGVYGNLENRVSVAQAQKGNKKTYFFSRVFMPYRRLIHLYPVLQKHKWLFPFLQVARWFRIFSNGRAKRTAKEFSISMLRSETKIDQTQKMLKDIGL